jgi:hypothetical protein
MKLPVNRVIVLESTRLNRLVVLLEYTAGIFAIRFFRDWAGHPNSPCIAL